MPDRDHSRIPSINRRVHREVLFIISQVLENNEGIVRDRAGVGIDVSFMESLKGVEYDPTDGACSVGASYKQLHKIGHQVGLSKRQMGLWVKFCSHLPLSQRMATHLISNL